MVRPASSCRGHTAVRRGSLRCSGLCLFRATRPNVMHQKESYRMGKRVLYVGGLSDSVSDCNLRGLFGTFGLVARAHVVRHKHSGKSAGYGFVEMGSVEQALEAVVALEGMQYDGNCLRLYVTPY